MRIIEDTIGTLSFYNNEKLTPGKTAYRLCDGNTYLVLLPVAGDLLYSDQHTDNLKITIGQALVVLRPESFMFEVTNYSDVYGISFLQLRIQNSSAGKVSVLTELFDYDLRKQYGGLTEIVSNAESSIHWPFDISIKQFTEAEEFKYTLKNHNGVFIYVLAGEFGAAGRLMHANDSLSMWDIKEVGIEALSSNAIILVVELPEMIHQ